MVYFFDFRSWLKPVMEKEKHAAYYQGPMLYKSLISQGNYAAPWPFHHQIAQLLVFT